MQQEPLNSVKKDLLDQYVGLLLKWNKAINLIGKSTEEEIWGRHIKDSLQLAFFVPANTKTLIDLGTGAGFPGMVMAIIHPEMVVTLVESDQRKAAFLQEIERIIKIKNIKIKNARIEEIKEEKQGVVTSRALASLDVLLSYSQRFWGENTTAVFPKGRLWEKEVIEAKKTWNFSLENYPSKTEKEGRILTIQNLEKIER